MDNERKVQVKGRSGKKAAVIAVCAIAILVLGVSGFIGFYLNNMLTSINHVEVGTPVYTEPAETTAVAEVQTADQQAEKTPAYAEANAENYLVVCKPEYANSVRKTDTMILCTLNTTTKTITMTALKADAEVTVPAYKTYAGGEATLDTVYGLGAGYGGTVGSMELMNQTLYDNFNIKVDHNLEIDMKVFAKVVGSVDGVKVELTDAEAAYLSKVSGKEIPAGACNLNQNLAQQYVDMWSDDKAEGVNSAGSQRKLVEAIIKEVRSKYVDDLHKIVKGCLPMVTTSMTEDELEDVLFMLLPMLRNLSIESGGTIPAA